ELGPQVDADLVANAIAIGRQGDDLFTCSGTVTRLSIQDGHADTSDVACDVVTGDASGLWVSSEGTLTRYADWASITAHAPASQSPAPHAASLAIAHDGSLLGAEAESSTLFHVSTQTGATTGTLTLEGYSGMILGLATPTDDRIVVAPWYTEGALYVF